MSVCLVLFQNYFKLIFQTFVSLLFFFVWWGMRELMGVVDAKNILKWGGAKNIYTQG